MVDTEPRGAYGYGTADLNEPHHREQTLSFKKKTFWDKWNHFIVIALIVTLILCIVIAFAEKDSDPSNTHLNCDEWGNLDSGEKKQLYENWKTENGIEITNNALDQKTYSNFAKNCALIYKQNHNRTSTIRYDANRFLRFNESEFLNIITVDFNATAFDITALPEPKDYPESVDWANFVTPVKDQGDCATSWAFSPVGAIESRCAIEHIEPDYPSLSSQQCLDCISQNNCGDGSIFSVYEYSRTTGLCEEKNYPYTAEKQTCQSDSCGEKVGKIFRFFQLYPSEVSLMDEIQQGPISVLVHANGDDWQFYESGILTSHCAGPPNHALLLTGYGVENDIKYWNLKNSWGTEWGENGYIRFCRNCGGPSGQCGLAVNATVPDCGF